MTGTGTGAVGVRHAVACLFNARGDHALALPTLRALAAVLGDRLTVLCRPGMPAVFFPELAGGTCEPRTDFVAGRHWFDVDEIVRRLGPPDLFLSLNPWRGAVLDELVERLRPGRSVGFGPGFDVPLEPDRSIHNVDQNLAVARTLDPGLTAEPFSGPPVCDGFLRRSAARLRGGIPPGWTVLALHAETKPAKTWPPGRVSAALGRFLDAVPDVVVLDLGVGPATVDPGRHADRIVRFGDLSLPFTMALLGEADLFLGVDSCLLHVADLYRVPGVGLFGPSDPAEFGFRFSRHRHLRAAGMDIAVDDVVDALLDVHRARDDRRAAARRPAAALTGPPPADRPPLGPAAAR